MSTSHSQSASTVVVSPLLGVVAPTLGWAPPLRFLLRRARVLSMVSRLPPGKLVEVGCGAGSLLHELARANWEAVGIETSERARCIAESIASTGEGKQTIVDRPDPAWNGDRDLVCAFDVLEHIENDDMALLEWSKWLRPGGYLCISVPAHRKRWSAGDEWAGHWRRYDRRDIEVLIGSNGLVLEHMECYGFPLGNITEWYGDRFYRRALKERGPGTSKEYATQGSGVNRDYYLNRFNRIDSFAGRAAIRLANALQALAVRTDWGSGYLFLARKP